MGILQILIPPVIGGIIGYITNDIAIKMLFHPRKAIYIGKRKLPFTPGLIPKEKDRVAKSIGNVISTKLLNSETLVNALASEEMLAKIRTALEKLVTENKDNTSTLSELLLNIAPEDVVEKIIADVKSNTAGLIHTKLTSFEFGENISKNVLLKVRDKIDNFTFGVFVSMVDDKLVDSMAKCVGELINKSISENSKEIVENLIGTEIDKIKEMPVNEIIIKYESKIPTLIDFLVNGYKNIIENHLSEILKNVNLSKIVEEKVASFSVIQLEEMIFGIMKKELNAIVYLGAVLGFIMGWFNLILNYIL